MLKEEYAGVLVNCFMFLEGPVRFEGDKEHEITKDEGDKVAVNTMSLYCSFA